MDLGHFGEMDNSYPPEFPKAAEAALLSIR
jgi:hypothetical protein